VAASRKWIAAAAKEFRACLGTDLSLEMIRRLEALPGANKSASDTLFGLRMELTSMKQEEK
jgi:hypothetical protein